MDGVVAFKVHGDLSWDGADCQHAAHTNSTANSNTVYFCSAYILHYHFVDIFYFLLLYFFSQNLLFCPCK